jgi:hypothetical protein
MLYKNVVRTSQETQEAEKYYVNTKFYLNPSSGSELKHTDGQTDMLSSV